MSPAAVRTDRTDLLLGDRATAEDDDTVNPLLPVERDDPFTPQPLDPATVTGTDAERLAAFERVIDEAKETAGRTLKAARARFVVEAGTALRAIRDEGGGLYKVTHGTFEEYIAARWDMDRSRAYQLIDAAPAMLVMSKIFDTAPVESQARAALPALEGHGEPAVKEIIAAIKTAGEKITAATITAVGRRLGYIPEQADDEPEGNSDGSPTEHTPEQALAVVRLEQGLAALRVAHKALRGTVVPDALAADRERGLELAAQVDDLVGKISRLTP